MAGGWQTRRVRDLLTYGPGVPRYLALWLPLAPLLLVVVRRAGASWGTVGVVALTTVPTLLLHTPPAWLPDPAIAALVVATVAGIAAWLVRRVWAPDAGQGPRAAPRSGGRHAPGSRGAPPSGRRRAAGRSGPRWGAIGVAAVVVLCTRVPLAWLDPGISDLPRASALAAEQLLDGRNPWAEPNPEALIGRYQYPAGTVLAHVPFVGLLPGTVGGEQHVDARAVLWATDLAAVVLLGWGLTRAGHPEAGSLAALAYALHPTLARESGMTVANDVLMAVLVLGAALAIARGRPRLAAVAVGLAISVKPPAAVLVPLLLAVGGPLVAGLAVAVPVALQLPFLLWPTPGLWGLDAMAEPAARATGGGMLARTVWAPLAGVLPPTPGVLRALTVLAVLAGAATAWAAGRRLRAGSPSVARTCAAVALPLLVTFLASTRWQLNFQDWYLPAFLAAAAVAVQAAPGPGRHPGRSLHAGAAGSTPAPPTASRSSRA